MDTTESRYCLRCFDRPPVCPILSDSKDFWNASLLSKFDGIKIFLVGSWPASYQKGWPCAFFNNSSFHQQVPTLTYLLTYLPTILTNLPISKNLLEKIVVSLRVSVCVCLSACSGQIFIKNSTDFYELFLIEIIKIPRYHFFSSIF